MNTQMLLTCDSIDAATAERIGLVSRVVPEDKLVSEAIAMGQKIASFSKPIGTLQLCTAHLFITLQWRWPRSP